MTIKNTHHFQGHVLYEHIFNLCFSGFRPLVILELEFLFALAFIAFSFLNSPACSLSLPDSSPTTPLPTDPAACPPAPPALPWPTAVGSGNGGREAGKYCCLCGAWFNNPLMAQQHYEGKKHRRNAARARLLEQLAGSLDATESTGQHLEPVPRTLTNEGQRGC